MGFSASIIAWYMEHHRRLPWRDTNDPYQIWVSEVILQQTRVDQGLDYYHRFIRRFPDISALASANEEEVLKVWQGLGYYSRARNMHQAAREMESRHDGKFPSAYKDILALKGIGEYTASAVASFAFGLPYPVLDGNATRLICRFFGIYDDTGSARTRKKIMEILVREMDAERPALFNQALMEFGALGCTPQKPFCNTCPLANECAALRSGIVDKIPVKEKRQSLRERFFHYLVFVSVINRQRCTILNKRTGNDIWRNLYEFPMIEADKLLGWDELRRLREWEDFIRRSNYELVVVSGTIPHILSHRKILARFFVISCSPLPGKGKQVTVAELKNYPVHTLMNKVVRQSNITFDESF